MTLTQKDIAKMIGVAESTVSRALNNKPGVGKATRKKILKLAQKYNYKPNQLAQGLAKKKTHLIAMLFSELNHSSFKEIATSVEKTANKAGYQVILCNTDNDIEKEKSYFELIKRNIVDGAVIVGGDLTDKKIHNIVLKKKAPIVLVNKLSEELLIPTILIDFARGGYLATTHLIKQGLDRIAIITGPEDEFVEMEKLNGYKQALKEFKIPFSGNLIFQTGGKQEDGYKAFLDLIDLKKPPQGFFVTKDLLTAGLIEAIKRGGYLIPGDFSVITYGDTIISSVLTPALSMVSEPLNELGKIAAGLLIKLIKGEKPSTMIKVLEPELKIKESSLPQYKT